ncbi:unnamed protein product [Schistosoma margrebowiei]|uniref:Uncharacterized protein n=1 Tax=Schistosoma margrebowiei TaxID=48269 RepID=A0A183LCC4_9TREM|nr:unnamed protein product [Schistosoma margrebowiei]
MKTSTSEWERGIQWTARIQLDDLDLTDDLALLSNTQQQMQEKTTSVAATPAAVGLNIHRGKNVNNCKLISFLWHTSMMGRLTRFRHQLQML